VVLIALALLGQSHFWESKALHLTIKSLVIDALLDLETDVRGQHPWLWATGKKTMQEAFDLFNCATGPELIVEHTTKIFSQRSCSTAIAHIEA
jgi:hypothetical protein